MSYFSESVYLSTIIDDELIRYVIWAYYGNHDQALIKAIDKSFDEAYNPPKNPDKPGKPK